MAPRTKETQDKHEKLPKNQTANSNAPIGKALQALEQAKAALDELAAYRRNMRLSDTRARNVAREIHEQIKVIRAYDN